MSSASSIDTVKAAVAEAEALEDNFPGDDLTLSSQIDLRAQEDLRARSRGVVQGVRTPSSTEILYKHPPNPPPPPPPFDGECSS